MLWGSLAYLDYFVSYPWWAWVALGYVVFVIGSTMFSSRKDLEGSAGVVIGILMLCGLLYVGGFWWVLVNAATFLMNDANNFFQQLSFLLGVPLGINSLIILLGSLARHRVNG
jgi:hypothetical protein